MSRFEIKTADDEDPNCLVCRHVTDGYPCEKYCGPEHWWAGYERTERVNRHEEYSE